MSVFLRKYNTLLVAGSTAIRVPIIKRGVVDFAVGADWTPAAGDVKVTTDNAAAANVTNLPTAVVYGNTAMWEFVLTAAELSGKSVRVTVADSATKAVEDQSFIVETFGNASAMYPTDVSASILPAALVSGRIDASIGAAAVAVPITSSVKKNAALAKFAFLMTDSTNHAPATGKTVTCTRSIDGAAFGAGTLASVTEVGNGIYTVDFGAGDLNGNVILLRCTATACDDAFERIVTQP